MVVYLLIKILNCHGPQKTTWNRQSTYEILSSILFYLLLHLMGAACATAGGCNGAVGGTSMSCVITSLCYRLRLSEESFLSDTLTIHGYILFPNQRGFLPHLATHTVSLPPSRLSCDTPDFIVLPCVYERETKRGASKRLEGRRTIWQWLFLWWQISNVMEILFLACLCGEKNRHFFK